jgi:2'-5' RNA ligase
MRLFIGVALPDPLRSQLASAVASLREAGLPRGVRVLHEETWHVTLQFLGNVDEALAPRLSDACNGAFAQHASFDLQLSGAGAFPSAKRARTIWVGLSRGHVELAQLAATAQHATAPLGFTPEERAFRAHVTWARAKPEADVRKLLDAYAQQPSSAQAARVHEAVLYRSHTSSEGARYEVLSRFALAAR